MQVSNASDDFLSEVIVEEINKNLQQNVQNFIDFFTE